MDTFDKWFSRFMWSTDIILLVASMPHIAAWFAHFDNPSTSNILSELYAWGVGFGLAFAIDGVSFMLLLAMTRMIKSGKTKSWGVMTGLIFFMALIAALSWDINWQYNVVFASQQFAKADAISYGPVTVGGINPIIGGAFPVLMLAYALVAKAMQTEVKSVAAYSDEDFQQKLKRIQQEKELKAAQKGAGFWEKAKEAKQGFSDLIAKENDVELIDELEEETDKETNQESEPDLPEKKERNTGPLAQESDEENDEKAEGNFHDSPEENEQETNEDLAIDPDLIPLVSRYPNALELLTTSASTVLLSDIATAFDCSMKLLRNRVDSGKIRRTKNADKVYLSSVIEWAKGERLLKGKPKGINLETARKSQEKANTNQTTQMHG